MAVIMDAFSMIRKIEPSDEGNALTVSSRNELQWATRLAAMTAVAALVGCNTYKTSLNPVDTTYPRTPRVVESISRIGGIKYGGAIKIWDNTLAIKARGEEILSYDTYVTKVGDDATVETFIHDPMRKNATPEQLVSVAKRRGAELCGGRFGIVETTYFYGDEATPGFYGLANVKSMRAIFRCPLDFPRSEVSKNHDLITLSGELLWPGFFDILALDFQKKPHDLLDDVKEAAARHDIVHIKSGRLDTSRLFYLGSGNTNSRLANQRIEQLAAIIEPAGKGSRLRIIFPAMRFQTFRTSVSNLRKIPDRSGGLVPWERSVAYDRARYFLSIVSNVSKSP